MSTPFTSPTGRIVWGSPFTPTPVMDDKVKPPVQKTNADGSPMVEYSFGVAFRKDDPEFAAFWATLKAADRAAWPQFHDAAGQVLPGVKFADKLTDGDGRNTKGKLHSEKDGYAGHWVVKFASRYAPSCHQFVGGRWVQLSDPSSIKPGYFIRVDGTTQTNNSSDSPGMHRNPNMVALIGYGAEIARTNADPAASFGTAPAALPPGASAVPLAPSAPMPAAPGVPGVPQAPAAPMAPAPAAPAAPAAPVAPYDGYMVPPAPPVPAGPVMLPAANGVTYEAYKAAGWTDALLIAQGYMAAPQ